MQRLLPNQRIGKDIDQHRRHIRRDHARAFGDACNLHGLAANRDAGTGPFGERVGRHDRAGGILDRGFSLACVQLCQFGDDAVMRQRFTDNTCRGRKDPSDRHTGQASHSLRQGGDAGDPILAGKGVGIARVDKDRGGTGGIAAQLCLTIQHGRRPRGGPGEHPRHHRSWRCDGQHHIGAVLIFYPRRSAGKSHARDHGQVGKLRRRKW